MILHLCKLMLTITLEWHPVRLSQNQTYNVEYMSLNFNVKFIEFVKNNTGKETCIIRMFGITANGNSVVAHVHNFTPYFYVEVDAKRVNL
jgi:DNA polymerase elongation subunit (family B)